MNKILRWAAYVLLIIIFVLVVAAVFCFTTLDTAPYKQTDFYKKELTEIEKAKPELNTTDSGTLQVGWARVNLLPQFTTPIAIDAKRGGKHFVGVHDSIYVRAFVFKQGEKKVAFVSADLLILPPAVSSMFDTLMQQQGFNNSNIYYTAVHTHTSIGAWQNSYVGEIFAGKYDARIPAHIAKCIAGAILQAEKNCGPARLGFAAIPTQKLVFNRLVKEKGDVDSLLRIVKIVKQDGERAAIVTFAAHATVFHEKLMSLSADWPGLMMNEAEKWGKIDFVSFSAGAVGSMGPYQYTLNQEKEAAYIASGVAALIQSHFDRIGVDSNIRSFSMVHIPLYLRAPNLRISNSIVVRPWLFYKLFGNYPSYINSFRLGNIVFNGMPCDFSGELVHTIDSVYNANGQHEIITSFNGGYIGYITDHRRYDMNTYETRTMGWFGPGNDSYLQEILEGLSY